MDAPGLVEKAKKLAAECQLLQEELTACDNDLDPHPVGRPQRRGSAERTPTPTHHRTENLALSLAVPQT